MSELKPFRIKCMTIPYRKGFIELTPGIHEGCINLEIWEINAESDIDDCSWVDDESFDDSEVTANCEIELSLAEAQMLAEMIQRGVDTAREASD